MRGISIVHLEFPAALQDPDLQVKCLAWLVQNLPAVVPGLPPRVRGFLMRGHAPGAKSDVPLFGLQERMSIGPADPVDYDAISLALQRWIDGQDAATLLATVAAIEAPRFDDLDDRKAKR